MLGSKSPRALHRPRRGDLSLTQGGSPGSGALPPKQAPAGAVSGSKARTGRPDAEHAENEGRFARSLCALRVSARESRCKNRGARRSTHTRARAPQFVGGKRHRERLPGNEMRELERETRPCLHHLRRRRQGPALAYPHRLTISRNAPHGEPGRDIELQVRETLKSTQRMSLWG